tara:strand:+ start:295 stop:561 length:267 start_codon:yes stop_codon:yes gene_type:complete
MSDLEFSPVFFNQMSYNGGMEKICDICGGSGQLGQFRGLSRFVLTYEECPECYGTGIRQGTEEKEAPGADTSPVLSNDDENNVTPSEE